MLTVNPPSSNSSYFQNLKKSSSLQDTRHGAIEEDGNENCDVMKSPFQGGERNLYYGNASDLCQALCLAPAFLSRQRLAMLSKRLRVPEGVADFRNEYNSRKQSLPEISTYGWGRPSVLEEKLNASESNDASDTNETNETSDRLHLLTRPRAHTICPSSISNEWDHAENRSEFVKDAGHHCTKLTKKHKKDLVISYGTKRGSIPTTLNCYRATGEKRLSLDSSLNLLHVSVETVKHNRSNFSSPSRFGKLLARRFIAPAQSAQTMLQYAVTNQDYDTLRKILTNDNSVCDINFLYPPGVTVLHQACVLGDINIVKLLIQYGADVRQRTWQQLSPTKLAAIYGHFDVAQLLILTGADEDDVRNGLQFD